MGPSEESTGYLLVGALEIDPPISSKEHVLGRVVSRIRTANVEKHSFIKDRR